MSGARPDGRLPPGSAETCAEPALPALAMSGALAPVVPASIFQTMMASRAMTTVPATIHAVRSDRPAGADMPANRPGAAAPHLWQNRAWAESSAPQALHDRAPTAAPQEMQNFP